MAVVTTKTCTLPVGNHRARLYLAPGSAGVTCSLILLGELATGEILQVKDPRCCTLGQAGDAVEIVVRHPTELVILIAGGSRESITLAEVSIEQMTGSVATHSIGREGRRADHEYLRILAHIERRGDVVFQAGDWIGNAKAHRRIEGLSLQWPECPAGITLQYQATMAAATRSGWKGAGEFIGSRGRALPIVALALQLLGGEALGLALDLEAEFLTTQSTTLRLHGNGTSIGARGRSGTEVLVGLRVSIGQGSAFTSASPIDYAPQTGPIARISGGAEPTAKPTTDVAPQKPRVREFKPSGK